MHTTHQPALKTPLLLLLQAFAIITLGLTLLSPAQAAAPGGNGKKPLEATGTQLLPTSDTLTARITELEQQATPDEMRKHELSLLRQALSFLNQAQESEGMTQAYEQAIKQAPTMLKKLEAQLAKPLEEPTLPAAKTGLDKLTEKLKDAQDRLEEARRARAEIDQVSTFQAERRQLVPASQAAARKRLDELKAQLATTAAPDQPSQVVTAKRYALLAEQAYLKQHLLELDEEIHSYDIQRDLIRAQKELAERNVLYAERLSTMLEGLVSTLRTVEAEKTRQAAEEVSESMMDAHSVVRSSVEQNQTYATELATVSARIRELNDLKMRLDEQLTRWSKTIDSIKEKTAQIGLTDTISLRLRNQLSQLPDPGEQLKRLRTTKTELNQVQLRRIELDDNLLELVDIRRVAEQRMREAGIAPDSKEYPAILEALQRALNNQKSNYLAELIRTYDIFIDNTLVPLHESERRLLTITQEYRDFIAERILWIQSTHPLAVKDIQRSFSALGWLLHPGHWLSSLGGLLQDAWLHPIQFTLPLLLLIGLAVARLRLRQRLIDYGERATKPSKARFTGSLAAAGLTLLLAATWPLLLWLPGWRLTTLTDSTFSAAIGNALIQSANVLFLLGLTRQLCRPHGLAIAHFHWRNEYLTLVRQQLRWFLPTLLPLTFVVAATDAQPIEAYRDSLGRLTFIAAMVAVTLFIRPIFSPDSGILHGIMHHHKGGWLDRLQNLWFPLLVATPLGLAAAAGFGYFYTAIQLEQLLVTSTALILTVITLHALFYRWLDLARRKLAIEQARKKLASQAKARAEAAEKPEAEPVTELDILEQELDVGAVSSQTQRLLLSTSIFSAFIGLLIIWKDVLPALGILRQVELWTHSISTTVELEGGTTQAIESLVPVTLADLGLAAVILALTVVISKNIPGLLEMAVLQRLPFTPSGRYAITTTVRYLIVIIGLMLAFGTLGIGWSKVQFLAAAITVGLGFGLQEIFANFVSGLIILFERPIRVGDTVTIGDISGKVSRIQMRATTITDWDRKELIIPNKEFVTGQVINWSLSDPTLRINMRVGIAYGSDTELATKLLLKVAREHPIVLKEPEPDAYFTGFGDSTLDFLLRVFIPQPEYRMSVPHDLLRAIDETFKEHKIEIAFPQRDLHIRSIDASLMEKMGSN